MNKYSFSLKYNIFPKLFIANSKLKELENSLNLKCYKVKKEKKNIKSEIFKYIFLLLFIGIIFKEVIL